MSQNCPICNSELKPNVAVCEVCGYKITGSTESFNPVSIDISESDAQAVVHRFGLRIVRGPQTGIDIDLTQGSLTIGRDPQCDVFLNDMTVSRLHATVEVSNQACIIHDENSFNGVWVNDRMIETCRLRPGDVIQIGVFCLIYRERL